MSVSLVSESASDDETCPDYAAATSTSSLSSANRQTRWLPPLPTRNDLPLPPPTARRLPRPLQRNERYVYTYNLAAAGTPLQFLVSVEPSSGKPTSGKYKFKLSLRIGGVERSLSEPTELSLTVDPRQLAFVVFVFPGKTKLPIGGLWCLRVWLRVNSVDHRLFGEDELWIGKDMDFASIPDASFARHRLTNPKEQVYSTLLGNAHVNFIVRWQGSSQNAYRYTLDYEAGGVSSTLFDDLELKLDHDPRHVTFVIYTSPHSSLPAGASHQLRVWLRSPIPTTTSSLQEPSTIPSSYAYQRIWKTDALKIGSKLDFASLGNKVIMGLSLRGGPETVVSDESPTLHGRTPGGSLDSKELFYRYVYH
ncbi:hypothetical protein AX14_006788 [Amanita brunnescens Koide BX004]|nr:hypothetical protein AX14_006788 [Amanita brunnescens Koide BX004]